MLTSKPMYKESKCMWGCITWCRFYTTIKPCVCGVALPGVDFILQSNLVCVRVHACSQDLKLVVKQTLELLAPSSL